MLMHSLIVLYAVFHLILGLQLCLCRSHLISAYGKCHRPLNSVTSRYIRHVMKFLAYLFNLMVRDYQRHARTTKSHRVQYLVH